MFRKKRYLISMLIMSMLIASITSFAATEETCKETLYEEKYIASCPSSSNGKHMMTGKAMARVYKGAYPNGVYQFNGYQYQCKHCYLVLVTENAAHLYNRPAWGRYVTVGYNDPIPSATPVYTNSIGYIGSGTDSYAMGFDFAALRKKGGFK